eukprot:143350_1
MIEPNTLTRIITTKVILKMIKERQDWSNGLGLIPLGKLSVIVSKIMYGIIFAFETRSTKRSTHYGNRRLWLAFYHHFAINRCVWYQCNSDTMPYEMKALDAS